MAILNNNPLIGSGGNQGYNINNSLRLRSSASAYLSRTPSSATNQQTWTYSTWIKLGSLSLNTQQFLLNSGTGDANRTQLTIDDGLTIGFAQVAGGSVTLNLTTSAVYRDPSAWYHIVIVADTTNATASNRAKIYVNGVQVTAFGSSTYWAQNTNSFINTTNAHFIGKYLNGSSNPSDWYQAETNFIDGQALTPSSFGETDTTTGVWKPKAYTGTYGTNGFYLKFSDIATTSGSNAGLGKDFSGNSNYWTTNNISVTSGTTYDAMTDSPTNTSATVANYCVLNPLDKFASLPVTNGNLTLNGGGGAGNWWSTRSTIWVSSGKWYWESTIGGSQFSVVGVAGVNQPISTNDRWVGFTSDSYGYYGANGNKVNNNTSTSYGSSYTAGDVIGVALDMDAGTIVFYKNNTSQGTAFTGVSGLVTPGFSVNDQGTDPFQDVNFGQRPFSYTPPTGFVALNTFNLPTSTVVKGNSYMDATLYTGTGSSQSISGVNFQPDFVWIKERSGVADHGLYDAVRGVQKQLESNTTTAETTETTGLTAFNSNGFTVGALAQLNTNTDTYVGWSWKANGAGSSNTAGTITSTVSVNTTAGFSIVTYTGIGSSPKTVGHGLGVAPKMILLKNISSAVNWYVWHTSLGATQVIEGLNTTGAAGAQITFNNTLPTSSVISLGNNDSNNNGTNYVLYVWAEIAGYSAFGSYTGNGSTDGPFVFTNLKARFIMIKRTDSTSNWTILDTAREGYNVDNDPLYPNLSDAEGTTDLADILSNGFKLRSTDTSVNANAGTYIYACFSSNPFKNSTAV